MSLIIHIRNSLLKYNDKAAHQMYSQKILIYFYGVPATGKTSIASICGTYFNGAPLISTDIFKTFFASQCLQEEILKYTSDTAWKMYGNLSEETFSRGYETLSEKVLMPLIPLVEELFKTYKIVFIEGAHINATFLRSLREQDIYLLGIFLPLQTSRFSDFTNEKLKIRHKTHNRWLENLREIEYLNKILYSFQNSFHKFLEINSICAVDLGVNECAYLVAKSIKVDLNVL